MIIDNKVFALPGLTLGLELQFLNFMSAELNFQAGWEHMNDRDYIFMAAGLELKFPLKLISNVILEPYAAVKYPIFIPDFPTAELSALEVITWFPMLGFGGGFQIAQCGRKTDAARDVFGQPLDAFQYAQHLYAAHVAHEIMHLVDNDKAQILKKIDTRAALID